MTWKAIVTSFVAAALIAPAANAQNLSAKLKELDAQLTGDLLNDPTRLDWAEQGANYKSEGFADPAIPGGGAAKRFAIGAASPDAWTVQAYVPLLGNIERGETVTIGFWGRAVEAATKDGQGTVGVRVQDNVSPWPGFGDNTVKLGSKWEWHEVSATATVRIPRRTGVVTLQLGAAKQTIEIGQTIVVKGAAKIVGAAPAPASPNEQALASLSAQFELPPPLRETRGELLLRPDQRGWGHSGPPGAFTELENQAIWLGKATRFTVTEKGENRWDVGTSIRLDQGIAAGDHLLVAIAARSESAQTADGNAVVGIRVQSSEPPYPGFADNLFKVGPSWQLIRVRTTATEAIEAGKATIALHFAEAPQVVDIGPVYVFKTEE
ncbi:hypothetical protein GRI89_11485 [Altererythrobacter salegens]|uniref:CBM-cenC domain-containing protein n=1 Tax=Croceibacterium salegens TaxID=1737568 RepID=A0A6I4SYE3_9SPHN|nr:hypothetical protein [Croceibacterium salegens]MXO60160.1 hypothetical protein [Croceibacterium salegens]